MTRRRLSRLFLVTILLPLLANAQAAEIRDGRLFDPQRDRTSAAEGAHEDLAAFASLVGDWDLVERSMTAEGPGPEVSGRARIEFINRGHALLLRTRVEDFDGLGHDRSSLHFLAAANADGAWSLSGGDNWTESISVFTGSRDARRITMVDARRPGGSRTLLLTRKVIDATASDHFTLLTEQSTDAGVTWSETARQTYTRRASAPDFFATRDDVGRSHPDHSAEAAQFDFLLGEFDASHWLLTPGGPIRWMANATATRVLDGAGILEFSWHDNDPSLRDAATSILRLYNRSMRRWESLYLSNRGSVPLHFGGVKEGRRIVLHPFDANSSAPRLSQWIFFDVRPNAYRWKGRFSTDRGANWTTTWAIELQRKGTRASDPSIAPSEVVNTFSADGVTSFGDHYRSGIPGSPTVLLFHQAGGDARGEYGGIARRLVREGFEVFAWDARGGGNRFGEENRTVAAQESPASSYCEAYPDLEAALEFAWLYGSGGPIHVVGSSYSAALVIRLAAEHGARIASVAAFSPASSRMDDCAVDVWQPRIVGVELLVVRPESEMKIEAVAAQAAALREAGVEVFVAPGAVHGASALNEERSTGDVESTWVRFLEFLRGG